jgi:prepilin-type processing-associated H-X9-DG protein
MGLPGGYLPASKFSERHLDTGNVLFIDGHVKAMKTNELVKTEANTTLRQVAHQGGGIWATGSTSQIFHYWQTSADAGDYW